MYPQALGASPAEVKKMQIITLVRNLYTLHHPDACGESCKTQKQPLTGWGDWFCPHLSLYCSLRAYSHCSLGGFTTCGTVPAWCLKGFTRCAGNSLQERDDTSGQECPFQLHPGVPVTQHPQALQLCSEATLPQQTPHQSVTWRKIIKHQQTRPWECLQEGQPREVPGSPSLSCRFQQAAHSVQEAAAGQGGVDALCVSAAAAALRVPSPAASC